MEPSTVPPTQHRDSSEQCCIFLFGDLTVAFEDDFRQLLHCKSDALLQSFFEQINLAFRHEIGLLPTKEQAWFPGFTNLIDLAANIDGTFGAQALRFGILCVYQLGRFIQYASPPEKAPVN